LNINFQIEHHNMAHTHPPKLTHHLAGQTLESGSAIMKLANFAVVLFALCNAPLAHAGEPPSEPLLRIDPREHTARINRIASDEQGRWLVTVSDDKTAKVWDLRDGRLINTLRIPVGNGDEGKLYAVALSPDGQTGRRADGQTGRRWRWMAIKAMAFLSMPCSIA
jgi:WD40 repeat protein